MAHAYDGNVVKQWYKRCDYALFGVEWGVLLLIQFIPSIILCVVIELLLKTPLSRWDKEGLWSGV
jgi:hypothetical protein